MSLRRTAIDASHALTVECLDTSIKNDTGLNTRTLLDLQKFLACSVFLKHAVFDNEQKMQLKIIVSSTNFSARTSLVFKSNDPLRTDKAVFWFYRLSFGHSGI